MDQVAEAREKNERNARVQARYDAMMAGGKHGHYETLFKIVREEIEAERERCAAEVSAWFGNVETFTATDVSKYLRRRSR